MDRKRSLNEKAQIGKGVFGRRQFCLLLGGLGLGVPLAMGQRMGGGGGGMGGGGGGMGGGGGTTVIDPPVGGPFSDPAEAVNVSATPGVVEVNLEARIVPINVNGTMANLMTYNGKYPGPTIRVRKGDILAVNLTNSLPATTQTNLLGYQRNITNLHTHGWHVSPNSPSDFVMYDLMPGETFHHIYETDMLDAGALNFYHPHRHGVSAEQYWAGLAGPLVVEDETNLLSGFETHIMVLKDISLSGTEPAPHSMMNDYMMGKEGSVVMVNGQVNPRLYTKKGQVQRWRILNASNARFYRLALESHTFQVIGTDGGLLDKPYARGELLLSPGERVDVLIKTGLSSGNYRLRALPYARHGMMSSPTITLLTMSYNGNRSPAQSVPAAINTNAKRLNISTAGLPQRTLALSMGMGNGYINGQDFDVNPYVIDSDVGTYEVWTIVNQSGMDHPFHQHVNHGQVLSISGGDANYASMLTTTPARKDTVLVPKWGSVTLLIPVMDFCGMAMFHCHILEHEDIGMMGIWNLMGMGPMPMEGGM
ncbi:MAG: multicopper oxidase family protein [bacterium]|nr:multicopper oxidase family protein [bacterium]